MPDFSQLKKHELKNESTLTLYEVALSNGEAPEIKGKFAGESNKLYFNAILVRTGKKSRKIRAKGINANTAAETRKDDRELFPKHIITGWNNVVDAKGEPVEFTQENCAEFIAALPDHIFDIVRAHFSDMASFQDDSEDSLDIEEAVEVGNALQND